jgi:hypothetical protein
MNQLFALLLLLSITTLTWGQQMFDWPIKELDTAREVNYLSDDEKAMILEMNKVRYNPPMYARHCMAWLNNYYDEKFLKLPGKNQLLTNEGKAAYIECIQALESSKPAPLLYPSRGMSRACRELVNDQSTSGATGHTGKGKTSPIDRIKKLGNFEGSYAENIHYGDCNPAFAVMSLLIDDGVPSRGHRLTLLDPTFNDTGVAIGTHKIFTSMFVSTYATRFIEK